MTKRQLAKIVKADRRIGKTVKPEWSRLQLRCNFYKVCFLIIYVLITQ